MVMPHPRLPSTRSFTTSTEERDDGALSDGGGHDITPEQQGIALSSLLNVLFELTVDGGDESIDGVWAREHKSSAWFRSSIRVL